MKRKFMRTGILLVSLTVILIGCSERRSPGDDPRAFHGAYPYPVPPVGHFNSFITNNMLPGIYWDLLEQPLTTYTWADHTFHPLLATRWEFQQDRLFRVTLRQGVRWSDGRRFTSRDVVVTYQIARLMNQVVWRFLDRVEAPDDSTVVFSLARPNAVIPRYILRDIRIRAASVYGPWADRVAALAAAGHAKESKEWKALLQAFSTFRPPALVVSGPFTIDPQRLTESLMILTKVPTAWNADRVRFDQIVLYNGETPTITPLALAKVVDYATHGFPPAIDRQFRRIGLRVLRPPIYAGPSLYLNHAIHPFELTPFRQALALAMNRHENATVAMDRSAVVQRYMAGLSDNLVPRWVSADALPRLNPYDYNPTKAAAMLRGLGFRQAEDGVWLDERGTRLEFELNAPAEYADNAAAAENLAEQLTKFGIKTVFRGVQFQQFPINLIQGKFQMALAGWGAGNPHPYFAYVEDFFHFNYVGGVMAEAGPGMNFRMKQQTRCVGEVDLEQLVLASAEGLDPETQKPIITKLTLAYNELLPQIPLWERYGNNPVLEGTRVTGWPPDGDPRYRNSPYADSFTVQMILDGVLRPSH